MEGEELKIFDSNGNSNDNENELDNDIYDELDSNQIH